MMYGGYGWGSIAGSTAITGGGAFELLCGQLIRLQGFLFDESPSIRISAPFLTDAEAAQAHAYWRFWNEPAAIAPARSLVRTENRREPRRLLGESVKIARRTKRRRFKQQLRRSATQ